MTRAIRKYHYNGVTVYIIIHFAIAGKQIKLNHQSLDVCIALSVDNYCTVA